MTPKKFAEIGEALYGPSWRIRLSQELEVSERTVRRWQDGTSEIPEGVAGDLAKICRRQAIALMKMAEGLD